MAITKEELQTKLRAIAKIYNKFAWDWMSKPNRFTTTHTSAKAIKDVAEMLDRLSNQ